MIKLTLKFKILTIQTESLYAVNGEKGPSGLDLDPIMFIVEIVRATITCTANKFLLHESLLELSCNDRHMHTKTHSSVKLYNLSTATIEFSCPFVCLSVRLPVCVSWCLAGCLSVCLGT